MFGKLGIISVFAAVSLAIGAQAKAEERKALAVAIEQECPADVSLGPRRVALQRAVVTPDAVGCDDAGPVVQHPVCHQARRDIRRRGGKRYEHE